MGAAAAGATWPGVMQRQKMWRRWRKVQTCEDNRIRYLAGFVCLCFMELHNPAYVAEDRHSFV